MSVITAITEVFSAIGEWIVSAIAEFVPIFYVAETGLTFLGVLCVASLGVSMIFLLIGIIQRFLKFRS